MRLFSLTLAGLAALALTGCATTSGSDCAGKPGSFCKASGDICAASGPVGGDCTCDEIVVGRATGKKTPGKIIHSTNTGDPCPP
jgi:hypothetical protein